MTEADVLVGQSRFLRTQERGLRLGIACRTIAVGLALLWYVVAVSLTQQEPRWWTLGALGIVTAIGLAHLTVIGTRYDRWWMKYLLFAVDILTVCALFVIIPVSRAEDVPQIIAFRAYGIYYLFPLIVLSALSLSWKLVLWSGAIAVAGWWTAFFWVVSRMQNTLSWADIPAEATRNDYETVFLSIDFIGRGNRFEETGLLFVASAILAVAVYRARKVFFSQLYAEDLEKQVREHRNRISETFGRYVPHAVIDKLVESGGKIAPAQSRASILVMDIEGFTKFSAGKSPEFIIETLDEFLSSAADIVGAGQGVVVSYTGDGLLASFNAPLDNEQPERSAVTTATKLVRIASENRFRLRIGIATGDVVSGTVGSSARTAFTVYGETVNKASRLEALGKPLKRSVVLDENTAAIVRQEFEIQDEGLHNLRGFKKEEPVFSVLQDTTRDEN